MEAAEAVVDTAGHMASVASEEHAAVCSQQEVVASVAVVVDVDIADNAVDTAAGEAGTAVSIRCCHKKSCRWS